MFKQRKRVQATPILWQDPPRGHIGADVIAIDPEIILTDFVPYAMDIFAQGHRNVVALRSIKEMDSLCALFKKHDTRRIYFLTTQRGKELMPCLERTGIEIIRLRRPRGKNTITDSLAAISNTPPQRPTEDEVKLTARHESYLIFSAKDLSYRVESMSLAGLGMRVQVKVTRNKLSFLDKLDLASATSRRKFSRLCAVRIGISSNEIEDHLSEIADQIDQMQLEQAQAQTKTARVLAKTEQQEALSILQKQDVLAYQANALASHFHFIGENENVRLALLVAASRLLDKPLGAILRGPGGCGKSALIQAVSKLLPLSQVLFFSRMTPKALFFMPKDYLINRLLVCDEYAGMAESEYALRTMMSNQSLSLAITLREGGRVPVTRNIEIPACVSVLVSTTGNVNIENLSRFIELRLDASVEQNQRVMQALAAERQDSTSFPQREQQVLAIQNVSQCLRPCSVKIPFANSLIYKSGNVLARRQFVQVVGLISARTALHQYQRETNTDSSGRLTVIASKADYEAVHPLLGHVIDNFEEEVSPPALMLLEHIQRKNMATLTRKDVMENMGWPYSRAYRVLNELVKIDLLIPYTMTNGTKRVYEVADYHRTSGGITHIAPPQAV